MSTGHLSLLSWIYSDRCVNSLMGKVRDNRKHFLFAACAISPLDNDAFMSWGSYRHVVHPLQFRPMQMRDYKRRFVIRRSDIRLFYCPRATAGTEGFASVAIFWLLPLLLPPLLPAVLFLFEVQDFQATSGIWRSDAANKYSNCWTNRRNTATKKFVVESLGPANRNPSPFAKKECARPSGNVWSMIQARTAGQLDEKIEWHSHLISSWHSRISWQIL